MKKPSYLTYAGIAAAEMTSSPSRVRVDCRAYFLANGTESSAVSGMSSVPGNVASAAAVSDDRLFVAGPDSSSRVPRKDASAAAACGESSSRPAIDNRPRYFASSAANSGVSVGQLPLKARRLGLRPPMNS